MTSYTGLSPKNPSKYTGPNVYLSSIVTRSREPTAADYRQPETGKLYPIGSYWLVSKDPTTGTEGDLWYLSKITSNVAYWLQISSGGSGTLIDIEVDAVTAPGVNPVTPLLGQIDFNGSAVANHSVPVETHSRALHEMNVEVQYATSAAATDATKSGLAHFNSAQFSVDANGFVELGGGGLAIDSIHPDSGTDPVVPTAAGLVNIIGSGSTTTVGSLNTLTVELTGLTNHSVLVGSGTTTITKVAPAAAGTVLTSNGVSADPSFQNIPVQGVTNLGISYSAGIFTVRGATASLSASNVAYVTIPSNTAGNLVTIPVTADQTFIDDAGASTIIGNLFGLTTGIAGQITPFFIYAVLNDAEDAISFMISRFPNARTSPVVGKIGKTGSAVASTQGSFFALSDPTVADYDENTCISIGSFRMIMSTSDDWTVQTLLDSDGIGTFQQGKLFVFPVGQFGAASGKYYLDNGGTAPAFTDNAYNYTVSMNNTFTIYTALLNASTAGVGAVALRLALPYTAPAATFGIGWNLVGGVTSLLLLQQNNVDSNNAISVFTNSGGGGTLTNADIALTSSQNHNATLIISSS